MRIARRNYIHFYPLVLLCCWLVVWLINQHLKLSQVSVNTDTAYWVSAKILIWLLPVFVLIEYVERARPSQFLELTNPLKGLAIGLLISLPLITLFYVLDRIVDRPKHLALPVLSLALLNGVIVAPVVEEIVFRGFYLPKLLLNGIVFWVANGITTIFFLSMHLPGWYFQGKLHLDSVLTPIASIAFLSLLLGLVKVKTRSLYATIVIHLVNNLYSLAR